MKENDNTDTTINISIEALETLIIDVLVKSYDEGFRYAHNLGEAKPITEFAKTMTIQNLLNLGK